MKEITQILEDHKKWLKESGGSRANLREANLWGANLWGANLREADLWRANLRGANLGRANLREADLWGANLRGANLREADLWGANLRGANLRGANLREADLWGANLRGANLTNIKIDYLTIGIHPAPEGELIGWGKKFDKNTNRSYIVKLLIPKEACRSCATTRKFRAEYAICLEIEGTNEVIVKNKWGETIYKPGERVFPHEWCEDRWQECAGGIHFFLTREEAEQW